MATGLATRPPSQPVLPRLRPLVASVGNHRRAAPRFPCPCGRLEHRGWHAPPPCARTQRMDVQQHEVVDVYVRETLRLASRVDAKEQARGIRPAPGGRTHGE